MGVVNYYLPAHNVGQLHKLRWVMETSLLKTLAYKHKATVMAMVKKYKNTVRTPDGVLKCFEVYENGGDGEKPSVARFGGIHIRRQRLGPSKDKDPWATIRFGRSELLQRVRADKCELCEHTEQVEVHHIRKLSDLKKKGRRERPAWVKNMAARRRKTLVVCRNCHMAIHSGRLRQPPTESVTGEPDDAKVSRPVRTGVDGKVLHTE